MLPRSERVSKALFDEVFRDARPLHSPLFMLRVLRRDAGTASQFAFVVPKTVAKKATERNLLRRRGYEIIGKHKKSIVPGYTFLFFFKKGAADQSFSALEDDIGTLLDIHGLLESTSR